jgi:hypothetical protein
MWIPFDVAQRSIRVREVRAHNVVTVDADPDDGDVGAPVRVDRDDVTKVPSSQKFPRRRRQNGH